MGLIYDEFASEAFELWSLASKITNKPIHSDLTWTCGFMRGKGHGFLDLQIHAILMASSVIITEPVIPKIVIGWDSPLPFSLEREKPEREENYPILIMRLFGLSDKEIFESDYTKLFYLESQYVNLIRHFHSVNSHPFNLGIGYRTKYHGLDYVTTKYGIIVDTDTISIQPCCQYIMNNVSRNPDSFCWTILYNEMKKQMNVGLVTFNMELYNTIYKPHLCQYYWNLPRGDVYWIGSVFERFPHLKTSLKIQLFDDYEMLSTGKYKGYTMLNGDISFQENKSLHYHAWKGEYKTDQKGFVSSFHSMISNLKNDAKKQLGL